MGVVVDPSVQPSTHAAARSPSLPSIPNKTRERRAVKARKLTG